MTARVRDGVVPRVLRWGLPMAAVAALTLGAAGVGRAQSQRQGAAKSTATAAQKPASPRSAARGLNTGITVHGHWILEVRNPDGSLVRHVEFENSLDLGSGTNLLAGVLLGSWTSSAQTWQINLSGSPNPCLSANFSGSTGPNVCIIQAPNSCTVSAPCQSNVFTNLSATSSAPTGPTILTLTGSAIAAFATQISEVSTSNVPCLPTVAPQSCSLVSGSGQLDFPFTDATNFPGSPVGVGVGQTIQATVTISFQ